MKLWYIKVGALRIVSKILKAKLNDSEIGGRVKIFPTINDISTFMGYSMPKLLL